MKRIFFSIVLLINFLVMSEPNRSVSSLRLTILGTGYVGLVNGVCLADLGYHVTCADIDHNKIQSLHALQIPIYEPGLQECLLRNVQRLTFTTDIESAIACANVIFVAVPTPCADDGSANISAIEDVMGTIVRTISDYKIIVMKSTVPIGTCQRLKEKCVSYYNVDPELFDIISCPEFLREGKAVDDFFNPDRIVIGGSQRAIPTIKEIYRSIIDRDVPVIETDLTTAETIKYVSNSFLGLKVSFINEMANLCDAVGIDVVTVARAVGLDKRIGPYFLSPGPGFGGYCFPKDIKALLCIAHQKNVALETVQATLTANENQFHKPVEKLVRLLGDVRNKTIAILGLAFKANTDDVRESPVIKTIALLKAKGAHIKAYDPAAMSNMSLLFPDIEYCPSTYRAIAGADAVLIMTEWNEFKNLNLKEIGRYMNQRILIDARNIINTDDLKEAGFQFDTIGRACCAQ
jgi:UDPglucose 6-dehydrogenase